MTAPIMGDASTRKDEKPIPFDNTEALKRVKEVLEKYYPQEKGRLYDIFTGYVLNVYMNALVPTTVTKGGEDLFNNAAILEGVGFAICRQSNYSHSHGYCVKDYHCHKPYWDGIAEEAIKSIRAYQVIKQPSGDGWQPIETAPKDGSEFLGTDGDGGIRIIFWHDKIDNGRSGFTDGELHCGGQKSTEGNYVGYAATHWMPLPPPPQASDKEEGVSNGME